MRLVLNYRTYTKKLCEISMELELILRIKQTIPGKIYDPSLIKKIRQLVVTERLKARSVRYGFEPLGETIIRFGQFGPELNRNESIRTAQSHSQL